MKSKCLVEAKQDQVHVEEHISDSATVQEMEGKTSSTLEKGAEAGNKNGSGTTVSFNMPILYKASDISGSTPLEKSRRVLTFDCLQCKELIKFVRSAEEGRSSEVAQVICRDIANAFSTKFMWEVLLSRKNISDYDNLNKDMGQGPEGRLAKLERITTALNYYKSLKREELGDVGAKNYSLVIEGAIETLGKSERNLRREKRGKDREHLQNLSNQKNDITEVNKIVGFILSVCGEHKKGC